MKNPIRRLAGKKAVLARQMTLRECVLLEAEGGFIIEFDGGDTIHIVTKTLDCDEFPSDGHWTEVHMISDGEVIDLTERPEVAT